VIIAMSIQGTRLETPDEVREALARLRSNGAAAAPRGAGVGAVRVERDLPMVSRAVTPADDAPTPFRPTRRPPTPILVVHDDGEEDGELVRLRQERLLIGRTDGDLIFPQDAQMSGRHAEIVRTFSKEKYRWHLADLKSTNGTYVRIGHAILEHTQQFIVGRTRYRFDNPTAKLDADSPARGIQTTQLWQSSGGCDNPPTLVQVGVDGGGTITALRGGEAWIGKDASCCQVVPSDDPFVSARHARLRRDEAGRWTIENNKSVNGVWLRVERIQLKGTCCFLLGEQQFTLRITS
jgi:pSer/pThr/pTyr-binding forkhead associated (FHA) protein